MSANKCNNIAAAEWIAACEARFAEDIRIIAEDMILKRKTRIVRLFGPSCAGKTTAAHLLVSAFERLGKRAHIVSIDDFYYSREYLLELSRAKGFDGLDYDSPDTIDLEAMKEFVREIFSSEEVHCPIYDFSIGRRNGCRSLTVDDEDIFIFEGIQANYKNVKEILSSHGSASIFIIPDKSIAVGDKLLLPQRVRLMRRLVRDNLRRGCSPEFTFELWKSVRTNEDENIFPHARESDYYVDSSMEYEVGVLKPYLCKMLADFPTESEFYPRVCEILDSVKDAREIPAELILPHYLYREFV